MSIAQVDQRLLAQGYSQAQVAAFKTNLKPDQILSISVHPYQVRALERQLYPYYDELLGLGYTYTEAQTLSELDHALLGQLMALGYVDGVLTWVTTDYLIPQRFSRYIAYAQSHEFLSLRSVVERVNANRDIPFYTQAIPAEMTHWPLLVNKYHYLSPFYVPSALVNAKGCSQPMLTKQAADAFDLMCKDLIQAGLTLDQSSAYRSYAYQYELYQEYVIAFGQAYTDTVAAHPGFSEHQTGYAIDLKSGNPTETIFAKTATYRWIIAHCTDYGFIQRYPQGKEAVTGYRFESWHYTYVGIETAKAIASSGLTLDEYLLLKSLDLLNP